MPALGIIADDFTGALMVAAYLEEAGVYAPVAFTSGAIDALRHAPVVIAASRTRTVPVAEAIADAGALADALHAADCRRLAYKACGSFDSTEEGNIGPIADYLADRMGQRPVIMSAGFPEFTITVHQGFMFYENTLVTESRKRFDPLTPMPDPNLVRFLGRQTPHKVALVNHQTLRQGPEAALARLRQLAADGAGHVLFDVSDDDDVATTLEVAVGAPLAVAASDPLIIALGMRLGAEARVPQPVSPSHADGPAAILVGSVGPVAEAQIAAVAKHHDVTRLDLLDPRGPDAVVAEALDRATRHPGIFAATTATEGFREVQDVLTPIGAARLAERMLSSLASGLKERGIRRFVVSGGETSGAVVAALGVETARSLPRGAVGTGLCVAGEGGLSLYLKPGKIGSDDILLRAVAEMER